jgi:hypothetical protein
LSRDSRGGCSLCFLPQLTRRDRASQSRLFAFCRSHGGARALSRALARALALHPTEAALWSHAAAWQWRERRDAPAARTLMQRALRACPAHAGLYADYFGFELAFAATLRERRTVLGLPLPPDGEDAPPADMASPDAVDPEAKALPAGLAALLRGAVAAAVFDAAAAALPTDVPMRLRCLDAARAHAWAAPLAERVAASFAAPALAASPAAWAARAAYAATPAGRDATFEEALDAAPSPETWVAYGSALAESGDLKGLSALARRAMQRRAAPPALLLLWLEAMEAAGNAQQALRAAEEATEVAPHAAPLWLARLRLAAAGAPDAATGCATHASLFASVSLSVAGQGLTLLLSCAGLVLLRSRCARFAACALPTQRRCGPWRCRSPPPRARLAAPSTKPCSARAPAAAAVRLTQPQRAPPCAAPPQQTGPPLRAPWPRRCFAPREQASPSTPPRSASRLLLRCTPPPRQRPTQLLRWLPRAVPQRRRSQRMGRRQRSCGVLICVSSATRGRDTPPRGASSGAPRRRCVTLRR